LKEEVEEKEQPKVEQEEDDQQNLQISPQNS
jgi:hypothetical protein